MAANRVQESLKSFFESMEEGVAIVGPDDRVDYVNPAMRREFGEPGGRTCAEYFGDRREIVFPRIGNSYELTEARLKGGAPGGSKLLILRGLPPGEDKKEEGEKYRRIVELAREGIWTVDTEARTTFVNPRMAQMLGRTPEEMLGTSIFDHIEERNIPALKERWRQRRQGITEQYDLDFLRKDGTVLHASLEATPIHDLGGKFVGAFACVADISRRKKTEEALRKSERELRIKNRIAEIFFSVPEDEIYAEVLRVVLEGLESKYGYFGYIDEDGALVCPSLSRDIWSECQVPEKSIVFPRAMWSGIWGRSLIEKRTVCQNQGPLNVPRGHVTLSRALCVPLVYREQLLGQIAVANKETEYIQEDTVLLESLAAQIATILHSRLETDKEHHARRRAEEALAQLQRQLRAEQSFAGIVGGDPKMIALFESIREVAAVDVPVLIQGESGTGKELVAAAIHSEGPRSQKRFVPVNCSALPEALLESELFGHVKGAFTGAVRDKKGRFELADGGTIFLDEVGDLSPPIQVSLLRVLQEGSIERVGDEKTLKIDVRVISATNRDLRRLVDTGKFREDLYYRLCVVPVNLPPLRERRGDIPLLAEHILKQICAESSKQIAFSPGALEALCVHDWPGNVRELQNAIYYASVKCRGGTLEVSHFPPAVQSAASSVTSPPSPRRRGRKEKLTLERVEKALDEVGGNKLRAAANLEVSRATLYKFLRRRQR